jgi:hypothetical protein
MALLLACGLAGCQGARGVDTQPLNNSGMSYNSVRQLEDLKVTSAEVADILKMHEAGFPDGDCVHVVQEFHNRGQLFGAGSAVAGLIQAGMRDQTILALADLNQLGVSAGELEAMHLAGLSDAVVLEVARHRADGKPVLAGATLARLKNMGVRAPTLLELTRRDIPDSEAREIISLRRRGASDAQILRRFPGS